MGYMEHDRTVGIMSFPDGEGFVTPEFIAGVAMPVVVVVAGERWLVTGWSEREEAFTVRRDVPMSPTTEHTD